MSIPWTAWMFGSERPTGTQFALEADMPSRVYMRGGRVAHVLDDRSSANSNDAALCGRFPWPELWRGTGNHTERGMAKDLPMCVGCKRALELIVEAKEARSSRRRRAS